MSHDVDIYKKFISAMDLLSQPWDIKPRRKSHEVQIGNIRIGGDNPIVVQSMTNTNTNDIDATVQQVIELANAGSEIVRITVNDETAAKSVPMIKDKLCQKGYDVPLIGDFHYNGHLLLAKYPACAFALDKYRINPGNVGVGKIRDKNFEAIIQIALKYNKAVRIGVNWGSLDRQILRQMMELNAKLPKPRTSQDVKIAAVVESALQSANLAESYDMPANHIVLSAKMSHVRDVVLAYTLLAFHSDYAIHLGLTEAGIGNQGIVASSAAISHLLLSGIGDTIRVSLTPKPGGTRTEEVDICQYILQTTGLRRFKPSVTSCPGCGRTSSSLFQEIAQEMDDYLRQRMPEWKHKGFVGVENLQIAVMGCVVNGPGESKNSNIGISLPGNGENPRAPVYVDGKLIDVLQGLDMLTKFRGIIDDYVIKHYGKLKQTG